MGLIMKNGIQYPGVGSGEGSGLEISQLDDVKITTPLADKESLVYNKEIGKWENKKISNESSLPYNLIVSEKWDNNISGGASENTVWTSKIFLTKGTYSIYDYVSWNSSKRIWYRYYFREMSDDFEGYFHGSQDHSQTNVTTDNQGWATFTTNEQFTITKGTAKIQLVFWGDAGQANSGGGTVSLYKIDGLNNSSGITELPIASAEILGGIKVGENLEITEDGTLNAKASGTSVLSPGAVLYDTEEKIIGKWINGKPLYQKVIPFTTTLQNNVWIETPELIDDKEQIIQAFVVHSLSYMSVMGNTDRDASNYIRIWNMRNTTLNITHVVIQYTKTIDAENSFNIGMIENINLEQNIDFSSIYSTDERIVGSWINGKPIYKKTFIVPDFNFSQSKEFTDDSFIEIEFIIGAEMYDLTSSTVRFVPMGAKKINSNTIGLYYKNDSWNNIDAYTLQYTKTIDEENSFTPDMIIDHENITDAEIADAAAADKI